MKEYVLDGARVTTLEAFYDEIGKLLAPDAYWGRSLDAFNDILRGGFGAPYGGFILRWENAATSRRNLGYDETVRQLELRLSRCHPSNRNYVREEIAVAQIGVGPTTFDWLIEIILAHAPGGVEESNVQLVLA